MQFDQLPISFRTLVSRRMQIAFLIGLVVGILIGWAFSGLVGAVMRFGLLTVLLVPLVLALILWWKVRQAPKHDGSTIVTWSTSGLPPADDDLFRGPGYRPIDEDVIDLEEIRRERKP